MVEGHTQSSITTTCHQTTTMLLDTIPQCTFSFTTTVMDITFTMENMDTIKTPQMPELSSMQEVVQWEEPLLDFSAAAASLDALSS